MDISDAMLYVIGCGFLFLILHACRIVVGFNLEAFLTPALYSLLIDVSILALLCCLTAIFDYGKVLKRNWIDIDSVATGIALFLITWFIIGIGLIIAA